MARSVPRHSRVQPPYRGLAATSPRRRRRSEVGPQGGDEAGDRVLGRLDVDREAALAGGGGGDRPDAGDDRRDGVDPEGVDEPAHGGRRGEGDGVGRGQRVPGGGVDRRPARCGRRRRRRRPSPRARSPSGSTSRASSARAITTRRRPSAGRRSGKTSSRRLGHEPLGHEVGHDPVAGQGGGGARPDGGDPHAAEGPGVGQVGEGPLDAVGRGEHEPVVRRRCRPTAARRGRRRRRSAARWRSTGTSTGSAPSTPRARLSSDAWVRVRVDDDPPAQQRPVLEPAQSLGRHPAHDDHRRRLERVVAEGGEGGPGRVLVGPGAPADGGGGRVGREPAGQQPLGDRGQRPTPMRMTSVPPRRAAASQSMVPSPGRRVLVAGDDGEGGRREAAG